MAGGVPPAPVRAFVLTPVAYVGALVVTILSPLLHLGLALIDLVDRKQWRFTRVFGLGIAFCVVEFVGLTIAFVLWIFSGFGLWMQSEPLQRAHRWLLALWLELITAAIRTFIGFDFDFPSEDPAPGPLLVLSRHAGPGDALLVARSLVRDHGRKLRMIGTTKLLWDPFFNHAVRRLPFYFCEQNPDDAAAELAAVAHAAATIETDGAMIIFPEGGNFTPRRRHEAIQRFKDRGQDDRARRAESLHNVLPPRTAGTLAALDAAASASAFMVAHVGLDDMLSLGDIWRLVPIRRTVTAAYLPMARRDAAAGHDQNVEWLFDQWQAVDDWIEHNADTVFGS